MKNEKFNIVHFRDRCRRNNAINAVQQNNAGCCLSTCDTTGFVRDGGDVCIKQRDTTVKGIK